MNRLKGKGTWARVRIVILTLLLIPLAVTTTAFSGEVGTDSPLGRRVLAVCNSLVADPPADPDAVADQLAGIGSSIMPILMTLEASLDTPVQVEVMASVRSRLKDPNLSVWLAQLASNAKAEETRIAAYAGLEAYGTRSGLETLLRSLPGNTPAVKRQADRALLAVLRRADDADSYSLVARALGDFPDDDRARVISAVARADSERGMTLLGGLVGRYPNVNLSILAGLSGMTSRPVDSMLVENIRPLLSDESGNLRREAISALGNLHDADSVDEFIALLGGEHAGVAGNAHWALRRLSGLKLPRDPLRWKMWLTAERSWWEAEGSRLQNALDQGDEALILRALHEASLHPLFQEEFADLIGEYADALDPKVKAAAKLAQSLLGLGGGPRRAAGSSAALASLRPASRDDVIAVMTPIRKRKETPPPAEGSNLLLLLCGLPVCLALLIKVSGLAPMSRLREWLSGRNEQRGLVELKLKPRRERLRAGKSAR